MIHMSNLSERLFIVPYLRWPREGLSTYELGRAQLLDALTHILTRLDNDAPSPIKTVLLDGQTSLLEAISDIRPDLPALLSIYNASGRMSIGPAYSDLDGRFVSGEAWVRNFLLGQADAERIGLQLGHIFFGSDLLGDAPQLPQILRDFGIDALCLLAQTDLIAFRWLAPNHSAVLVVPYNHREESRTNIARQDNAQPDGPLLWLADLSASPDLPSDAQRPLSDYISALRNYIPDDLRPKAQGPLSKIIDMRAVAGRLSARLPLKQIIARQEAELIQEVEPLVTLALSHSPDDNLRGWLAYAWRALLKNQSPPALGLCNDHTADDVLARARRLDDVFDYLRASALARLPVAMPKRSRGAQSVQRTHVIVWNLSAWLVEEVVESKLDLPSGYHPAMLIAPDGEAQMFGWDTDKRTLNFRAVVPPLGFAIYTVELADAPPESAHLPHRLSGHIIGNIFGETLVVEGERLIWKRAKSWINNLLRFVDGGDSGDLGAYRKPVRDILVEGVLSDGVETEVAALYERLIIHHRMRIAPSLRTDGVRERGIRLLDLRTTVTFYDNTPGVYFHTTFTNSANDHRLRAILQTGISKPALFPENTYSMGGGSALVASDDLNAMALLTRGLYEAEPLRDAAQTSLALTLLRSVGRWGEHPTPNAQLHGEHKAQYALVPVAPNDPAGWLRESLRYQQPLLCYQSDDRPAFPALSYLQLDGSSIVMIALKPPQKGVGWVLRLFNPTSETAEAVLTPQGKLALAYLLDMAEEPQAEFEIARNSIRIRLDPYKIATIRLEFAD